MMSKHHIDGMQNKDWVWGMKNSPSVTIVKNADKKPDIGLEQIETAEISAPQYHILN